MRFFFSLLVLFLILIQSLPAQTPMRPAQNQTYHEAVRFVHEKKIEEALDTFRDLLAQDIADYWKQLIKADTLHILGKKLYEQRAYLKSKETFDQSLAIRQELGADSSIAALYNDMSLLERRRGNHDESEQLQLRSIEIKNQVHPEAHYLLGISYNNLADLYRTVRDLENAEKYALMAVKEYRKADKPEYLGASYHTLGVLYVVSGEYAKAEIYLDSALQIQEPMEQRPFRDLSITYYTTGSLHLHRGDYDQALVFMEKVLQVRPENSGPDLAAINMVKGILYAEKGDYEKSVQYTQVGIDEMQSRNGARATVQVGGAYENLATIAILQRDYDRAETYVEKSEAIYDQLFEPNSRVYNATNFFRGQIYCGKGEPKRSIAYLENAFYESPDGNKVQQPLNAPIFTQLGRAYQDLNQYDKAYEYFQAAIQTYQNADMANHPDCSLAYELMSEAYREEQKFDLALNSLEKGRLVLGIDIPQDYTQTEIPIPSLYIMSQLLENVQEQSNIFLDRAHSDQAQEGDLLKAWHSVRLATGLIDTMRQKFSSTGSKELFHERNYPIYEKAINICFELYQQENDPIWLEEGFRLTEKNKSLLLLENLRNQQAADFAGIPQSVLEEERRLGVDQAYFEKQLFEAQQQGAEAETLAEIRENLFQRKVAYDSLLQELETHYPRYYFLKYQQSTPALSDIQQLPAANEAWLSYFVGENSQYVFYISPDEVKWTKLQQSQDWARLVNQFRKEINPQLRVGQDKRSFDQICHTLYQDLLGKLGIELPENLVIIPDGVLGYVPFDALLMEKPPVNEVYKDWPFLIKEHTISYGYSVGLHVIGKEQPQQWKNNNLLAFAPQFPPNTEVQFAEIRHGLAPLAYNQEEVEALYNLFGGKQFIGATASEEQFKQLAANYDLIHIASHALVNDIDPKYSHIRFSPGADSVEDGSLEVAELFTLSLDAEMVVLSACETGIGRLQKGEGIISLARGMSYAGAKSVVTTLWQVNDAATAEIITSFYENLDKGQSKAEALRSAKLAYLNSSDQVSSHPFYWAAYIPTGNMRPLSNGIPGYLLGILAILLGGLGIFGISRTLNKQNS